MYQNNESRIRPYSQNPMYWQYKGRPVLLLGGSKTDHLFLLDDLKEHLDEIQSTGGNYARNTMSQREGKELKPYRLLPNGMFDLDQWNDEYWERFENMLRWTFERDIIVQIEVWDRFDYSMSFWQHSPWNPMNNINYSEYESGLSLVYPEHPCADLQPFFHTIPGMELYRRQYDGIRERQEKFVLNMLSYSLKYPQVLYCMDNETSSSPEWGMYWMELIRWEAGRQGAEIYLTDMFDDVYKPEESAKLRFTFDNPGLYSFIDISQVNSRNFGEDHWEKLKWIFKQVKPYPRPVNNTKIYSDGYKSFGTGGPKDGVERFVRDILAGCASVRFHRDGSGIGLNYIAKAAIAAVRKLESLVNIWNMEPRMDLLTERDYNQAYLAARPGESYIVYFTYGGCVGLDLSGQPGAYSVKWIDMNTGNWGCETKLCGGENVNIHAPDAGGWIAVVLRT